jgi:hypothetical protein
MGTPVRQTPVRSDWLARDEFIRTSREQFPGNYRILADLNLPLYLTTNYDDFLTRALRASQRDPREVICRWNSQLFNDNPDGYSKDDPTEDQPVVFHLHGNLSKDASLLVTEDDYIDFTVSLTRPPVDAVIRFGFGRPSCYNPAFRRVTASKTGTSGS